MHPVLTAFGLTLIAGMATGIGSAIAFLARRTNYRFLSISTGFSAGVMLYVAFAEIFYQGLDAFTAAYGSYWGRWVNAGSFFAGILLIGIIDELIPSAENPHEVHSEEETAKLHMPDASHCPCNNRHPAEFSPPTRPPDERKLLRTGLFTALAIGIHNFPEGLVTFLTALQDPALGVAITVAIALHNIPEGISVSVPIFYATGNRKRAFVYSMLSGLAEPVGAGVAYGLIVLFLGSDNGGIPPEIMGMFFSGVAGIMVYISLDELLPTSRAYGKGHDSLFGLIGGMVIMALSLLLMEQG